MAGTGTGREREEKYPDSPSRKLVAQFVECDIGASEDCAGEWLPPPEIISEYSHLGREVIVPPEPSGDGNFIDKDDVRAIQHPRPDHPTHNDQVPGIQTKERTGPNNVLDLEDVSLLQRHSFARVHESQIPREWHGLECLPDPGQVIARLDNDVLRPDTGEELSLEDRSNKRMGEDEDAVPKKRRRDDSWKE